MTKVYCNKCGKEIPHPDSDDIRGELYTNRVNKLADECKYNVQALTMIKGIQQYPNCEGQFLKEEYVDLCTDCVIELNKLVGEFMDGTPVSTPA